MLDYGARFLQSKSARWTTPDPLAEKYCSTSPYAFCANNPVKYVDPDGERPRIYVETKGFGHAFVTIGEGEDIVVYSYGRYARLNKNKSIFPAMSPTGEGVLLRFTGARAKEYIEEEVLLKHAITYEFPNGSDELVMKYFDNLFYRSNRMPTEKKYKNDKDARIINKYFLLGNNCVTTSVNGVQSGVEEDLRLEDIISPWGLQNTLDKYASERDNSVVKIDLEIIIEELDYGK